jgi:DNA-binding NarL/FixJ family response regulator
LCRGEFAGIGFAWVKGLGLVDQPMHGPFEPLKVYVVEDSKIIRRLLASTIEAVGAELIGEAEDAESAIADLAMLRPDLVLIDIGLTSGTGFEVLEALRKLDRQPPPIKVMLTNHANPEYQRMSARMGADGFFDKTSETTQVLALISALASEKQGRDRSGELTPQKRDNDGHRK